MTSLSSTLKTEAADSYETVVTAHFLTVSCIVATITCVVDLASCEVLTVVVEGYRLGDVTFCSQKFIDVSVEVKVDGERFLNGDGRSENIRRDKNKKQRRMERSRGNFRKCSGYRWGTG
jgi:hypothetical protein